MWYRCSNALPQLECHSHSKSETEIHFRLHADRYAHSRGFLRTQSPKNAITHTTLHHSRDVVAMHHLAVLEYLSLKFRPPDCPPSLDPHTTQLLFPRVRHLSITMRRVEWEICRERFRSSLRNPHVNVEWRLAVCRFGEVVRALLDHWMLLDPRQHTAGMNE